MSGDLKSVSQGIHGDPPAPAPSPARVPGQGGAPLPTKAPTKKLISFFKPQPKKEIAGTPAAFDDTAEKPPVKGGLVAKVKNLSTGTKVAGGVGIVAAIAGIVSWLKGKK